MNMFKKSKTGLAVVLAVAAALSLSACTKKPGASLTGDGMNNGMLSEGANSQIPGSQGDLAANAGDKVYFEQDQSTLTATAQDTLVRMNAAHANTISRCRRAAPRRCARS
jgi:peptidoglycan-associated lipoprotein